MGFLDKVKDTAKQVGEKAQHGVEAGKDKLEDAKLKKKIGELKEQLGGLVYAQRTGAGTPETEAEIGRLVDEIKAAEQQLEDGGATADDAAAGDTAADDAAAGDG